MPTFATPSPIAATIDLGVGGIRLVATDGGETVVTVTPSDPSKADDVAAAEATRVDYAEGALRIKGKRPGLRALGPRGRAGSVDLTVELPTGSTVEASTGWGDVESEGELGDCRVKSGLGHVRLDTTAALTVKSGLGDIAIGSAGDAEIQTGSGDVHVRELTRGGRIKNANGDIAVGTAAGALRTTTANGSIAVDQAGDSVAAKSAFGDVRLGAVTRGEVVVETGAGDVEVGIPEGTAAWLDVRASAGRVENLLEPADAPPGDQQSVRVRARTAVGTIVIRRPVHV